MAEDFVAIPLTVPLVHLDPPHRPAPSISTQKLLVRLGWVGQNGPDGYNDAQPLSNPNGTVDPVALMAWVVASPWLFEYDESAKFNKYAVLVAVIDVLNPASLVSTANQNNNPLGLVAGTNCLYLKHNGGNEEMGWAAYVTQLDADPTKGCVKPTGSPIPMNTVAGTDAGDVPAVVRFVEAPADAANHIVAGTTLVGIKCGQLWCEIGARNYLPPTGNLSSRAARIKGWHDEQELWTFGSGGQLVLSGVKGKTVPDEGIESRSESDYTGAGFHPVLTIHLEELRAGAFDASGYGSKANANSKKHPWGMVLGDNRLGLHYDAGTDTWTAAIIDATGKVLSNLKVVGYMDHPSIPLPGTSRWYWTDVDDAVWIPCAAGCCTIESDS